MYDHAGATRAAFEISSWHTSGGITYEQDQYKVILNGELLTRERYNLIWPIKKRTKLEIKNFGGKIFL